MEGRPRHGDQEDGGRGPPQPAGRKCSIIPQHLLLIGPRKGSILPALLQQPPQAVGRPIAPGPGPQPPVGTAAAAAGTGRVQKLTRPSVITGRRRAPRHTPGQRKEYQDARAGLEGNDEEQRRRQEQQGLREAEAEAAKAAAATAATVVVDLRGDVRRSQSGYAAVAACLSIVVCLFSITAFFLSVTPCFSVTTCFPVFLDGKNDTTQHGAV